MDLPYIAIDIVTIVIDYDFDLAPSTSIFSEILFFVDSIYRSHSHSHRFLFQ